MSDTHDMSDGEGALLGNLRATPLVLAQARLAASRARLRRQFIRPPAPPRHERAPTGSSAHVEPNRMSRPTSVSMNHCTEA